MRNEAGQKLIEFCQENALVIANTLFQQLKRRLYTLTSPDGQHRNQIDYILCSQKWRSSIQSAKTRRGADYGSDHELLIAKFILCYELNSSHLVPLCLSKHVSFSKHLSYLVRELTAPARLNCWQQSKHYPTPSHPPPLKMVLDQDMCMLSFSPFINVFCNMEYVHKYKLSLLSLPVFS